MMDQEGFERMYSYPNQGSIPAFTWSDCVRPKSESPVSQPRFEMGTYSRRVKHVKIYNRQPYNESPDPLPVSNMIHQMLFKQISPFADSVQQSLFEWAHIHFKPCVKYFFIFHILKLCIQTVIIIDLKLKDKLSKSHMNEIIQGWISTRFNTMF